MTRTAIVSLKPLYAGWSRLDLATLRLPNGIEVKREIEDHGLVAAVLPYDPERRIAWLVSQMRAPMLHAGGPAESLEAPAGVIEDHDAAACARREALEEAGLALTTLEDAGTFWSTPGISTEKVHLFLAACDAESRVADGGGVDAEHEFITVHEVALGDLPAMLADGRISDMKTALLVQTLMLRQPGLFARQP